MRSTTSCVEIEIPQDQGEQLRPQKHRGGLLDLSVAKTFVEDGPLRVDPKIDLKTKVLMLRHLRQGRWLRTKYWLRVSRKSAARELKGSVW